MCSSDLKKLGAVLVARNIARHLEERFAAKGRDWKPLVYCWRGGQRSGAMAHVLRQIGWPACSLVGGYRSYRRAVLAQLDDLAQPFNAQPTTIAGQQYTSGTAGLGLFIVRRIAQAHGGDLHYDRVPARPPDGPDPPDPPLTGPALPTLTRFALSLPEVQP